MGIRFLCETCGKKLNIKQELAGKKGRCPKCNAVIRIPTESTLASGTSASQPDSVQQETEAPGSAPENAAGELGTGPVSSIQPPKGPQPTPGSPAVEPQPERKEHAASPPDSAVSIKIAGDQAEPKASASPSSEDPEKVGPPPPPASIPSGGPDVFAEEPAAKWFVRPSSGGQFGPAEADVLRNWLAEGRIGQDTLIWREGWDDWKVAIDVFPDQLGGSAPMTAEPSPVEPVVKKETNPPLNRTYTHRQARQRARMMGIILIVGLALVSIALAVVLIIVVNTPPPAENQNDETRSGKNTTASLFFGPQKNHNQGQRVAADRRHTDWQSPRLLR